MARKSDYLEYRAKYRYGEVKKNAQEADYCIIDLWDGIAKT
ncbi:hypothetical protein [Rhodonellum sp.]|nr:hypothetical protein [Rhodonellum sp.]MDO9553691.1 hypothetical protein [Rhodonellum sp.]